VRTDLARSLRRLRPERLAGSLARRDDADLDFADTAPLFGPAFLLDTCVYVHGLEGRLPAEVENLLRARPLMHLSLVLGELAHNFGRLDPAHPRTWEYLAELSGVIEDVPPHRLENDISAGVLLEAGILAGLVFRLGGFQEGREVAALIDATIYLHALERGYSVLTANIRDFDFMNQIVPAGRVLFYRAI
jgi:predicted nucleic acid-binding protein